MMMHSAAGYVLSGTTAIRDTRGGVGRPRVPSADASVVGAASAAKDVSAAAAAAKRPAAAAAADDIDDAAAAAAADTNDGAAAGDSTTVSHELERPDAKRAKVASADHE
jgi:hypothetical protein